VSGREEGTLLAELNNYRIEGIKKKVKIFILDIGILELTME
jgi:hypothetical protein